MLWGLQCYSAATYSLHIVHIPFSFFLWDFSTSAESFSFSLRNVEYSLHTTADAFLAFASSCVRFSTVFSKVLILDSITFHSSGEVVADSERVRGGEACEVDGTWIPETCEDISIAGKVGGAWLGITVFNFNGVKVTRHGVVSTGVLLSKLTSMSDESLAAVSFESL